ncbi:MAG: Uma2 family endonuclease [Saprospiraceae bacterium]
MITSIDQLDFNKRYSYADYLTWKFQERIELIKGKLSKMAAPSPIHQEISSNLHGFMWTYLRKNSCKLYAAPFDVRLPLPINKVTNEKIDTVIQPDLCVVCDLSKITKSGCTGAPDLVVEILSPGNSRKEMRDKFELYEEAGVLEYWIIDPDHRSVLVYIFDEKTNKFYAKLPNLTDIDVLECTIFPHLKIDLKEVFPVSE